MCRRIMRDKKKSTTVEVLGGTRENKTDKKASGKVRKGQFEKRNV